jgi:hypothetical protein
MIIEKQDFLQKSNFDYDTAIYNLRFLIGFNEELLDYGFGLKNEISHIDAVEYQYQNQLKNLDYYTSEDGARKICAFRNSLSAKNCAEHYAFLAKTQNTDKPWFFVTKMIEIVPTALAFESVANAPMLNAGQINFANACKDAKYAKAKQKAKSQLESLFLNF